MISKPTQILFDRCSVGQQSPDAVDKSFQVKRFCEEIIRLHCRGALAYLAGKRAHENDGNFFGGRLALQDFTHGQAIQVGQQNIEQDQIRLELPRLAQGMDTVVGHEKLAMEIGQTELHQFDEIRLVIHD